MQAELARYGDTTMAAIFALDSNGKAPKMSADMLAEVNRKLQTVLEDALLKNITLKVLTCSSPIIDSSSRLLVCSKASRRWARR